MKRVLKAALVALMLVPSLVIAQDLDKGSAAYDSGDYATALREVTPLAERGNADAQYLLGIIYESGVGVQDEAEAAKWYRFASDQGNPHARFQLGFRNGIFGNELDAEMVRLVRAVAVEQGLASSQSQLGSMYRDGTGVPRDYTEAARWYRLAAEQGYARAQFLLGSMYHDGTGVLQNYVTAHMWFNIAAAKGRWERYLAVNGVAQSARRRGRVATKMNGDDISEAQRRARVCLASNYQDCA